MSEHYLALTLDREWLTDEPLTQTSVRCRGRGWTHAGPASGTDGSTQSL